MISLEECEELLRKVELLRAELALEMPAWAELIEPLRNELYWYIGQNFSGG